VANRRSKTKDYEIGYRRPPVATQFQKGQSGNKKGRPKGSRPVSAVLQGILQQKLAVSENGKTRRYTYLEVMLRRLAGDAMRSDPAALKLILSLCDRYGETAETELRLDEIPEEDRAILERFTKKSVDVVIPAQARKIGGRRR
jgi:hypothetical protein